jgi:glycosyltransferase involved in cell wall biosynthesis
VNAIDRERPRVSIGLPVFNGENYISYAINSILAQTYRNFELIIFDNASTDATEAICRHYSENDIRIHYFRNPRNMGAAANFNMAFSLSAGEFFKWAAHDDLLAPECIEKCVAALDRQPDAVLAQPLVGIIDAEGAVIAIDHSDRDVRRAGSLDPSDRFAAYATEGRRCLEVFALIRRDALTRTSLIAPYPWSDIPLLAELALLGRFVLVPEVLFYNRDHAARFNHTALLRREASWRWWVGPDNPPQRFELCPYWYVELHLLKAIPKHLSEPRDRRRAYVKLLRHVLTLYVLSNLILDPIVALDHRIEVTVRRIKGGYRRLFGSKRRYEPGFLNQKFSWRLLFLQLSKVGARPRGNEGWPPKVERGGE